MSIPPHFQDHFQGGNDFTNLCEQCFLPPLPQKRLGCPNATIFTPIILPSFQTSELLAEAAIILPKFLAETHNHQEAAQKHQENSTFLFKAKIGAGSPESRANKAV